MEPRNGSGSVGIGGDIIKMLLVSKFRHPCRTNPCRKKTLPNKPLPKKVCGGRIGVSLHRFNGRVIYIANFVAVLFPRFVHSVVQCVDVNHPFEFCRITRSPDVPPDDHSQTMDGPPTRHYRCVCGADVPVDASACPQCGRPLGIGVLDTSLTAVINPEPRDSSDEQFDSETGGKVTTANGSPPMVSSGASAVSLATVGDSPATVGISPGTVGDSPGTMVRAGAASPLTGTRVGHFDLRERIGTGGMGEVYRALDTSLQRFVAVKVLRSGVSGNGSSGRRTVNHLLTEAVAQARLNHPHAVTIYFVGHNETLPFLAMELLPGPTVRQRLADGPLDFGEIITLGRQIVSALTQADAMGMTHGDVKPGNLLYFGPHQVKLGDFGLTRIRRPDDDATQNGISGTPNYIAPELLERNAPSLSSDMYALGITFFEMTFGRRPYTLTGDTLTERLETHRTAAIEFPERWPDHLPEHWRTVLARMLQKQPSDRYDSYQSLDFELARLTPLSSIGGGRIKRTLAYVFDVSLMMVALVPAIVLSKFAEGVLIDLMRDVGLIDNPSATTASIIRNLGFGASAVIALLPVIGMVWLAVRTRQTPGRYLMQLDVVDSHGFPATPRLMLRRSLLRNLWPITLLTEYSISILGLSILTPMLLAIATIVTLLNFALLLLSPGGRTLHDRWLRTRVVLNAH